ncbi:MAG: hypothetical protein ACREIT_02665 [Tepidisphaeraceae bacterium]
MIVICDTDAPATAISGAAVSVVALTRGPGDDAPAVPSVATRK